MSLQSLPRPIIGPRSQKLALRIVSAIMGLLTTILGAVYGLSEYQLRRTYDVDLVALRADARAGRAEEGKRLSHMFGCAGCHQNAGNMLFEAPHVIRLVAPNLTRIVPEYTDAEFLRLIRTGVRRDGTGVMVMPSATFANMSDDDAASLLAYYRSVKPLPDAEPEGTQIHFIGRVVLALGKVPFAAKTAQPNLAPVHRPVATPEDEGAYIVKTVCSHCHNLTESHDDGWGMVTPPLAMMGQAYSNEDFHTLMRTGKAMGNREVGLMSDVARQDLSKMTDSEINAIHAYLNSVEMPE